jgi:lathosterol oxidase
MTPYASIAFHPLDGICQASPYVFLTFLLPTHYITSSIMLFDTGIWASNIHVRPSSLRAMGRTGAVGHV